MESPTGNPGEGKLDSGFDPETPLESALTLPSDYYTDPTFLERESGILKTHWQPVGPSSWLKEPGDFFTGDFLGEPYVVIQNESNETQAFFNVCRHHAAGLLSGKGKTDCITCPYHAWSYALNGSLKKAPHIAGIKDFKRDKFSLKPIQISKWGPLVWLNFSQGSIKDSPAQMFKELDSELNQTGFDRLEFFERKSYEIQCNWKVFVDNYLDGGYHVPHMHEGLSGQLELDSYRSEIRDGYNVQFCGSGTEESPGTESKGTDFRERLQGGAIYAWIYPNVMINRYGPMMDINWVIPIDHKRTLTIFDYFVDPQEKLPNDFFEKSLAASHQVQEEDIFVSESVQKGLSSSAYSTGRYAPKFEGPMYQFHQMLYRDLAK